LLKIANANRFKCERNDNFSDLLKAKTFKIYKNDVLILKD